jgi:acylphosphatase
MTRARWLVRGRVQGVGFRWATVEHGRRLGLAGWARNLPDGAVEVVAEGAADAVAALRHWCQHGPPSARVTTVEETPAPAEDLAGEFRVRV